ncbi:MAG TPA: histidine kinase [Chitinophagaceae bacterium]|nr:histidine kinase [Chitinophagaceae bacterium]
MRKLTSPSLTIQKPAGSWECPIPVDLLQKNSSRSSHFASELLQQRTEMLRCAAEAAKLGYFILNRRTGCMEWSQELRAIFEAEPGREPLLTGLAGEYLSEEDYRVVRQALLDALRGEGHPVTFRIRTPSGKVKVLKTIFSRQDRGAHPDLVFGTTQDITSFKERQAEIINREKELRSITESAPVLILKTSPAGRIEYANRYQEQLGGRLLADLFEPEFRETASRRVQEACAGTDELRWEARLCPDAGPGGWYQITGKRVKQAGQDLFLLWILQDISESREVEQKICQAIMQTEERERNRISAELHDGVCQNLSAIHLLLSTLENRFARTSEPDPAASEILSSLRELSLETLALTRSLSHELMPVELSERGLVRTLEALLGRLNQARNTRYRLELLGRELPLAQDPSIQLYRITQEFIRNSQQHAGATELHIQLRFGTRNLTLLLTDNGRGFEPITGEKAGLGLANMAKRIRALNGHYQLRSRPGEGVRLLIRVPLEDVQAGDPEGPQAPKHPAYFRSKKASRNVS